jgi:dephospho-CoA kinase
MNKTAFVAAPLPVRIGLTGGIGSGKSTVARFLASLGAFVIDADQISRDLTAPGGAAIAAIRESFGQTFIGIDGAMDRPAMRRLVFREPAAKARLEGILHPLIYSETERQAVAAQAAKASAVVFDLPLLVESSRWRQRLDLVLVVDCAPDVQVSRVAKRSGLGAIEVQTIISQQAPRTLRLTAADCVIDNSAPDLNELEKAVRDFLQHVIGAKQTSLATGVGVPS